MDDLVQFLRDRLDEDEQIARGVEDRSAPWTGQWVPDGSNCLRTYNGHVLTYGHVTTDSRALSIPLRPGLVEHWARHDPARVLADVEAGRSLLAEYEAVAEMDIKDAEPEFAYGHAVGLGLAVRLRTLPYASHPDYQREWRPE